MKITYQTTAEDWAREILAFNKKHRTRNIIVLIGAMSFGVGMMEFIILELAKQNHSFATYMIVAPAVVMLVMLVIVLYQMLSVKSIAKHFAKNNSVLLGSTELAVYDDGLEVSRGGSTTKSTWSVFDRFEDDERSFRLYSKNLIPLFIPKYSVDSNETAKEVFEKIRSRINSQ